MIAIGLTRLVRPRTLPGPAVLGRLASVAMLALLLGANAAPAQDLTQQLAEVPLEVLGEQAQRFGDPARGAMAFTLPTMNCTRCHARDAGGRRLGPDLTQPREVTWEHLAQSILEPSAKIHEGYESVQVLLLDGRMVSGILVADEDESLVIDQIEQPEKPLTIAKDDIEDWQTTKTSSMPLGLASQLTSRQQFLDLVSYLAAIAKGGPEVAERLQPEAVAEIPLPEYEARIDHAALIGQWDRDALRRGESTYRLRCASCHGTLEEEGSMPTSLRFASGTFKRGSDPLSMYQTLTHGFGMMNPQRWMVPQQKYEVIHYIREHFLRQRNPSQYVAVDTQYLASLPPGDTLGPKPVISQPWTLMDYGPSLNNTIEVSSDGSNIAQKGIVVRLDDGPGGVESGRHWMLYEHDTLRLAAAWSGSFIDYEGIHFNGAHNRHPRVTGQVHVANPTGPGFARPQDPQRPDDIASRFADDRVVGRDDRHYGPLPEDWGHFEGLYRYRRQTILKYRIGQTEVLEWPSLRFAGDQAMYLRTLNLGARQEPLVLQVAQVEGAADIDGLVAQVLPASKTAADEATEGLSFDGATAYQAPGGVFQMGAAQFTIVARVRTKHDGTLLAKTKDQAKWIPQGKALFLRQGRPTFDVGWVGAVSAKRRVDDGRWHDVVVRWDQGNVEFFIDGEPAGKGQLQPAESLEDAVLRVGMTNENFPATSAFRGKLAFLRCYQRLISDEELKDLDSTGNEGLVANWDGVQGDQLIDQSSRTAVAAVRLGAGPEAPSGLFAVANGLPGARWSYQDGQLRLTLPAGPPARVVISHGSRQSPAEPSLREAVLQWQPRDLKPMTVGGPPLYPQELSAPLIQDDSDAGPLAVDVFQRPVSNPWNCRLRLTGIDFLPDQQIAVVTAWDGSVWTVSGCGLSGVATEGTEEPTTLTWRRIASGLFQPLGVKVVDGEIFVTCRDQLVRLHDLNGDGEIDWYENFNSDHQVTEHFHEFAVGLQVDEAGNFYYAKCARHAKPALVPQHGTLLRVSADGSRTEILANGFRAPNGVCLNGDGTYWMTDQEGHWTPKNRLNLVRQGGFYGNFLGYHNLEDNSDEAMEPPAAWITNAFDRSPSEMMWVPESAWVPLRGSLLNFSYGYGQIYAVLTEEVDGQVQGGMVPLPLDRFPTGIMRGRFHPGDGQLYCCGMFAWAGNQQQPGGLYRVRYTGGPIHMPLKLATRADGLELTFSDPLDRESAADPRNYLIRAWDLKRSANYGSKHLNERELKVLSATVGDDGRSVRLEVEGIGPTRGMEIRYAIQAADGTRLNSAIHNTIHKLPQQQ